MKLRRIAASVALTTLLLGIAAWPALAVEGGLSGEGSVQIGASFGDMADFSWGLNQVVRMQTKGVFKGRGPGVFAPGAKITHQEAAVATLRLMDKEAAAELLSSAEVAAMLQQMPDSNEIAVWARASVAMLVKLGVVPADKPFTPGDDATRLDIAVMLVKGLGFGAEAEAKGNVSLAFKDAAEIEANLVGYVATAVDHGIITGVVEADGRFFFPNHAVKRVEMAVMMGRADRNIDRHRPDELKGTVTVVSQATNSFTLSARGQSVTVTLAANAAIFVDDKAAALADLKADMKVEAKLDAKGKAIYVEAEIRGNGENGNNQQLAVEGAITAVAAATASATAKVSIDGTAYQLAANAVLTVDAKAATVAGLRVGDTVRATIEANQIVRLEAKHTVSTVTGAVVSWSAATQSRAAAITISGGAAATYTLESNATVQVDHASATLADLKAGDSVTLTLSSGLVAKIAVTREQGGAIHGTIASLSSVLIGLPGRIMISSTANGTITFNTYTVTGATQILINGQASSFADLNLGDDAKLTLAGDLLTKVEVSR